MNDTDRITYTLNKSVTFEQDAGSWKKNVLHPTSILFFENQNFSGYPFIDGASVIDSIETGLMDGWSHDVCRTVWEWDDGDGVPESANGELCNISLINTLTNLDDDHPSVLFAISCNVGYPEPNSWGNLGIDLATEPGWGAAVGMISASRPSAISSDWKNNPGGAEQICFDFNRYLISEGEHVGVAVYDGKYDATTVYGWANLWEYANVYNINLYGDPSLAVAGYPTGIEGEQTDPEIIAPTLLPACPNPFSSLTALRLTLPTSGMVLAVVYDISGRQVASLMEEVCPAGELLLTWDGRDNDGESLAQGTYFAVIKVGNHQFIQRMVRIRL